MKVVSKVDECVIRRWKQIEFYVLCAISECIKGCSGVKCALQKVVGIFQCKRCTGGGVAEVDEEHC